MLVSSTLSVLLALTPAYDRSTPEIHWAESYDSAFQEANDRGVPVVLIVIEDGEEANEDVWANILNTKPFIEACQHTVNVIASRGKEDEHGTRKEIIDGKERVVCNKFGGGIRCLTHNKMGTGIFRDFAKNGVIKTPQVIVTLPDQTIIGSFSDRNPLTSYTRAIDKARQKLPGGLSWDETIEIRRQLEEAETWMKEGDFQAVIEFTVPLRERGSEAGLVQRALLLLDRVEEAGTAALAEIDEQVAGKEYPAALERLQELREDFRGTDIAKVAKTRQAKLSKNREVKKAMAAHRREQKAAALLEKADSMLEKGKPDQAQRLLDQILDKFGDTEVAKTVRERRTG